MNIIIVEDEAVTSFFLEEAVEELGHNVLGVFNNSKFFLDYLQKNETVDVVLMDIKIMGEKDGIQSAIEAKKINPNISIAFITSYKDSITIERAKVVSPVGYLIKPIVENDIEALLMVVESLRDNLQKVESDIIKVNRYIYNKKLKEIYEDDKLIHLSKNERICLDCMIKNINVYTSQEDLIYKIWGSENNRLASLRELVFRLRKKLSGLDIKNISGVGYILNDN